MVRPAATAHPDRCRSGAGVGEEREKRKSGREEAIEDAHGPHPAKSFALGLSRNRSEFTSQPPLSPLRLSQKHISSHVPRTIFPICRHPSFCRLPLGIRDSELGSSNHPRRERAIPLLNQEGSPSVRPRSLWRGASAGGWPTRAAFWHVCGPPIARGADLPAKTRRGHAPAARA